MYLQVEHKHRYGGIWRNALDLIAHCQSVGVACSAFISMCSTTGSGSHEGSRRGSVMPVMEPMVKSRDYHKDSTSVHGRLAAPDEEFQLKIHRAIMAGPISTIEDLKSDEVIVAEVRHWRKQRKRRNIVSTENEEDFSEACRGLVSPGVCAKIIKYASRGDKILLNRHENAIARHLSAVYYEGVRWQEESSFYWDVIHGPADGSGIWGYERLTRSEQR